uniref:Translocon-associated protein subunit alpha n=1 Tax=Phaeocystis antarctica TaxID=33657 RepID=A0A7S0EDI2_9EUKA|mmetsp:Transcript_21460/g.50923  ORF Transcript_21460/g.50923 Transcript_21460/m.50923 type:complete len:245 (+) Transcript_21460:90-824(+)
MARYVLFATLLLSSAAVIAADEGLHDIDIDRTDLSDPALNADLDKPKTLLPHSDVEPSSMMLQPVGESLPIGVPSYLLVSLANLGPKMFNVTKINGIVSDVKSGKALANFTRRMYGDPLGPREQRSFRYPFVPNKKLSPGEYQMTFSVFYANRDKEGFSTEVYSGKQVLVAGPPEKSELPLTDIAMAIALVLGLAIAYTSLAPLLSGAPKSTAPVDTRSAADPSQWLPAASSPKKKKSPAAKRT